MYNQKPTILRSTFPMTASTLVCNGMHRHQHLQGRLPDNRLRSDVAKTYPALLCKRLAKDIRHYILSLTKCGVPKQSDSTFRNHEKLESTTGTQDGTLEEFLADVAEVNDNSCAGCGPACHVGLTPFLDCQGCPVCPSALPQDAFPVSEGGS